ncbi:MAG: hypothetical protein KDA21_11625 [Phycisphaerales bacterium]|nr:hypothetical protein [Phycisphaerales bacterium]
MTTMTPKDTVSGGASTPGGPLLPVLKFFSSVPLGIVLLVILFIYSWIGSAGLFYPTSPLIFDQPWAHTMPRQWRAFELTEFEWFHTWFFDIVIALIVVNVTVTTLRRIPLTILSAGVWCIHVGVVVLALGSVIYFGTKVEGDTPVIRRNIMVQMPDATETIPALLDNRFAVNDGRDRYIFSVAGIEPEHRVDAGSTVFAVNLDATGPRGDFNVSLVDGQPGRGFARTVTVTWQGQTVTLPVSLGAATTVGGRDGYQLSVSDIQPDWTLMTGPDAGGSAFGVVVSARRAGGETFMRQLLDGYPEFAEDFIPGRGRVVKLEEFGGSSFVDDTIEMTLSRTEVPLPFRLALSPAPQHYFWEKDSSALMCRELKPDTDPGDNDWWSYPINGLPRYNDYVVRPEDVWPADPTEAQESHPLALRVAGRSDGPLAGTLDVRVTGFLRYAVMDERETGGGQALNPFVRLRLQDPSGQFQDASLFALDPTRRTTMNGAVGFDWVRSAAELARYRDGWQQRRLTIEATDATGQPVRTSLRVSDDMIGSETPFRPLPGTDLSFRVTGTFDNLAMAEGDSISVLVVELKLPDRTISRWVASDPARSRDVDVDDTSGHSMRAPDPVVRTSYDPGITARVMFVAGDGEIGRRVFVYAADGQDQVREEPMVPGSSIPLLNGYRLTLAEYVRNSRREARPAIVPPGQRNRNTDLGRYQQWIQVELREGGTVHRKWLPFHRYSYRDVDEALPGLGAYQPTRLRLADGRTLEMMFSRERFRMSDPVVLDQFHMIAHTGGYETGRTNTIRDWESHVRFLTDQGPSDVEVVASNQPASWKGLWFFQSFWDPPRGEDDVPRNGLSYTGLGVGNRRGVYIQLLGCCMSVGGMLYAFYAKPVIRRRRRDRVYADVAAGRLGRSGSSGARELEPVAAGEEVSS